MTPGIPIWWALRPLWVLGFFAATFPFLLVFTGVERRISNLPSKGVSIGRLILGAFLLCAGLALLAAGGVSAKGPLGLDWVALVLPIVGGTLAGFGPHKFFSAHAGSSDD